MEHNAFQTPTHILIGHDSSPSQSGQPLQKQWEWIPQSQLEQSLPYPSERRSLQVRPEQPAQGLQEQLPQSQSEKSEIQELRRKHHRALQHSYELEKKVTELCRDLIYLRKMLSDPDDLLKEMQLRLERSELRRRKFDDLNQDLMVDYNTLSEKAHEQVDLREALIKKQGTEIHNQKATIDFNGYLIQEKNTMIDEQSAKIEEMKAEIEAKNAQIEEKNAEIEEKNAQIEEKNAQIEEKNAQIESLQTKRKRKRTLKNPRPPNERR